MERGKGTLGRGGKGKTPQYPADIFALGVKSGRLDSSDGKRSGIVHGKSTNTHGLSGKD